MKRILLCLSVLFLLTGCTGTKPTKSYTEIGYSEYQKKLENKETFVLYIGSATCSHCQDLKPVLEKVITDYDLEIYYIDLSTLEAKEYNAVWDDANLGGTPTIVFVANGNIKLFPRIEGAVSESVLIDRFRAAEYIKG